MFECPDCKKRFHHEDAREQHQISKRHCYCRFCNQFFLTTQGLQVHHTASHQWPCLDCGSNFTTNAGRADHQRAKGHRDCSSCDRSFDTQQSLENHHAAVHCHVCPGCDKEFATFEGRLVHLETEHFFCDECDRFFGSLQSLQQHLKSEVHASQFHCCDCDKDFKSQGALDQHLRDKVHSSTRSLDGGSDINSGHACRQCDAIFTNQKALKQHEASRAHNPLCKTSCVASKRCKKTFTSPSALLHHLESGGCRSGMNRKTLNTAFASGDDDHLIMDVITNRMNTLSLDLETSSSSSSSGGAVLTPNTGNSLGQISPSPAILSPTPEDAWSLLSREQSISHFGSGLLTPQSTESQSTDVVPLLSGLVCSMCPPTRKPFRTLESLQNHITSPAHSRKIFHCPPPSEMGVSDFSYMKTFSTISGLVQHLENGQCVDGFGSLIKVVRHMEQKLQLTGLGGLRLMP